jgi:hypothetical protein
LSKALTPVAPMSPVVHSPDIRINMDNTAQKLLTSNGIDAYMTTKLSSVRSMEHLSYGDGANGSVTQSRENFVRLAEARTTRLLKDIDLLANLSNRSNYTYTEEDVGKIFRAVQKKVREAEAKFRANVKQTRHQGFKL